VYHSKTGLKREVQLDKNLIVQLPTCPLDNEKICLSSNVLDVTEESGTANGGVDIILSNLR
jgi:hypothetical protein